MPKVISKQKIILFFEISHCFNAIKTKTKNYYYFSDILENLAWATAQIHCYSSSTQQDKQNEINNQVFTAETALNFTNQGQGNVVIATDPKILFCDLRLSAGESKSCK